MSSNPLRLGGLAVVLPEPVLHRRAAEHRLGRRLEGDEVLLAGGLHHPAAEGAEQRREQLGLQPEEPLVLLEGLPALPLGEADPLGEGDDQVRGSQGPRSLGTSGRFTTAERGSARGGRLGRSLAHRDRLEQPGGEHAERDERAERDLVPAPLLGGEAESSAATVVEAS